MKALISFLIVATAAASPCAGLVDSVKNFLPDGTPKPLADPNKATEWPNSRSRANSDNWIVKNHDKLEVMRPRILVVNFVNGFEIAEAAKKVDKVVWALAESSKYHGYKDKKAPAFLQPVVWKYVDLGDPKGKKGMACDLAPRLPGLKKDEFNCDYSYFFTADFASHLGIRDPKRKSHFMTLEELVDRGFVHELWMIGGDDGVWNTYECVELKQCYDESLKKIPGKFVQAGNGLTNQPWTGRSIKINYISCQRGGGCAMEDLGHSYEHVALSNCIPYFSRYFKEYAGFDLDKRFKVPFDSFYAIKCKTWADACSPNEIVKYPDENTAVVISDGQSYTIKDYYCVGGNLHFPPNARANYDMFNDKPVMSTIESYRMANWYDGRDEPKPWTCEVLKQYDEFAPDCMGRWIVYWRQNMPGLHNLAWADDGKRMKNWWPFLYY